MNDSYNRSSEHRTLVGVDSSSAVPHDDGITLSAKPHAFAGAVLSPKHARELTPSLCLAIASALAEQSHRKALLPYTLWISEAWRVLGWAEPSAALFWEMATMYHALYLATRAHAADYPGTATHIPPILSCGSNSSLGSGTTNPTERQLVTALEKKKISTTASAKELPAWLVGTFLLLHCEEFAYQRNLSGLDDRRFYGATTGQSDASTEPLRNTSNVDFATLFKHPSLSPRTRLHAGWNNDNSHCTAYLLRHLRKILLLAAIPQNQDAVNVCMHLAALPSPPPTLSAERLRHSSTNARPKYSPDELRRQHDEEHGQVGSNVKLTLDDLERLHLLLQLPHGGAFEDSPIQIGEFLWTSLKMASPPPMATIPLGDVEEEIRQHLEMELFMAGRGDGNKHGVSADEEETAHSALAKLSLSGTNGGASGDTSDRATQTDNVYQKELSYVHLRGKTIVLKPNPPEPVSGASVTSHEPHATSNFASPSRLHDLVISECSDAHFYLLQPFEHATIAACTGCTIVVGAVAGLLHIVDCEKTSITSAARRLLVSNSSDVQMCVFTPSPPLLVGDNRSCQFAPYNTYYDGFREDLLATGLAAAVVPEHQSPYHGSGGRNYTDTDGSWPPLQCASNKWKHPVELARLEMPQIPPTPPGPSNTSIGGVASAGADDKAMGKSGTGNDTSVHAPVLVPASEFHILFVPIESDASKQRRLEADENDRSSEPGRLESQYCRLLSELLQTSPFRLPMEYERRVLVKVDRMKTIQQSVQKNLTTEQQAKFEEELNRGFRDWLVTSGNLRQVLDLVHLERRGGV